MLAFGLVPPPGFAQSTSGDRQASKDKERAREEREWREIHRTQERMRDLDEQRAQERQRQNADWRREMDERSRRNQATPPAQPPATPGASPYKSPTSIAPPPAASTSGGTAAPSTTCSARPVCMAAGGRANLCMGVQSSYSGSRQAGLADITRRCREANTPDPCVQERRHSPAAPSYKLDPAPALTCAEQCAKVARCEPVASR